MIKQLLKQIWVQRAINIWLWVELVVVFVCLSFLVDYLYTTATTYYSPTGYDTRHVYQVSLDKVPSDSNTYIENETDSMITEHLVTALQRMRVYPGIESVCVTSQAPPYSQRQANGNRNIDTTSVHGWIFKVTPEFFRVFRVADKQGRVEPLVEAAMQEKTVIASVDVEHKFALKGVTALHSGLKNQNAEDGDATIRPR